MYRYVVSLPILCALLALFSAGNVATPAHATVAFTLSIDCDTIAPGIQTSCNAYRAPGPLDVALTLTNNTGSPANFDVFQNETVNGDTSRLSAQSAACPLCSGGRDANPDFNQSAVSDPLSWSCGPPAPIADDEGVQSGGYPPPAR